MQKVFIRGVKERGAEVIARLEALGGHNRRMLNGESESLIYYIRDNKTIDMAAIYNWDSKAIIQSYTEIFLDEPDKEPKHTEKVFGLYQKIRIKKDGCVSSVKQRLRDIDDNTVVYVLDDMPNTMFYADELEEVIEEQRPKPKFTIGDKVYFSNFPQKGIFEIGNIHYIGRYEYKFKNDYGWFGEGCLTLAHDDTSNDKLNHSENEFNKKKVPADYDTVMGSRDGINWNVCLYCGGRNCLLYKSANGRFVMCFKYIVPVTDFDFDDIESNIKRSVV